MTIRPLPREAFDHAEASLKKTLARIRAQEALAELVASGITFTVRDGRLFAGPPDRIVNGTAARIEQHKAWFLELVQEGAA